jgi:error-prone DNA polymerase
MYIELHTRSAFSFLEGASLPEGLIAQCAEHQMPALALLDRDGVYGAPRFHMAATRLGIRAHIGAEISLQDSGSQGNSSSHIKGPGGPVVRYSLLAENRIGYQNLCRLITQYKLRETSKGEGRATLDELQHYLEGLICLTGGAEGPLAAALERGGYEEVQREVKRMIALFGRKNIYVELQRHFDRAEEVKNQAAVRVARNYHLPLLATNGVRYARLKEREILDVLTCVRHHCDLETAGRLLEPNAECHLRPAQEMEQLFSDLPEAIANTVELSARLNFTLADLGYEFPRYPVAEGETMKSFLREHAEKGLSQRYLPKKDRALFDRAKLQLERELRLIENLHLEGYFLIVWDIVRFCNQQGILVQGRGSAANSVVCYSLGITAVDPVGMDLLFERFLSEERGEWPDIDLDLPSGDDRERAIQYVYERYGKLGAAMTANVITYRGRSATREVGKALGFKQETLSRLTSLVSSWEWKGPADTLENHFRQAGFDPSHPRISKYLDLCLRMLDLPRHLGQHSGGMVICQGQLDSVVPLEPATMPGRVVVQWDKEDCADMGIVKVDLLGLGMMAVLKDCLTLIPQHYEKNIDLAQLPQDDPEVYDTLQRADTVGMFQVESRAQMSALPRNRPTRFYDLVVQVAIIRPGPIVGKMMHPYMKRRQGREEIRYPHPSLEPILRRTLGVPLFQEQLLRMAMTAANFTGGEAEELRRALGHKRSREKMQEVENKLRRGMNQNGISLEAQEEIINSISSFALYGFPESHAASFALIAYASAYLKCHYLAAFTAALLNNQPMGFYMPATLVKDAQHHGLKVKPVDVLCSDWLCTLEHPDSLDPPYQGGQAPLFRCWGVSLSGSASQPEGGTSPYTPFKGGLPPSSSTGATPTLRLGLKLVRGLRQSSALALMQERELGPFRSIDDLAQRLPQLQKDELKTLAQIGALNSLSKDSHRRDALWQVEQAVRPIGPLLKKVPEAEEVSPLSMMSAEERLVSDFYGTGLTIGKHPMAHRRPALDALKIKRACDLKNIPDGRLTRIAGCVIARQRPGTAKGFVFLSLEDETGIANAIITPDIFEQHRVLVTQGKFLMIEGILQNQDNVVSVKAKRIREISVTAAETESHDFH